jgi:magnesium-protoporphyrin O-methyltransferase
VSSCQCQGIEKTFDEREAEAQLEKVRRKGPRRTTRLLIDALRSFGVAGRTLLDIGGGVGVVQQELLKAGLDSAQSVDASSAYHQVAAREMQRLGYGQRVRSYHGNFVDLAPRIASADLVTLDRVICCYDDLPGLLRASAAKARSVYGLVFPRDTWWVRAVMRLLNLCDRLRRSPFRVFVHSSALVEAILNGQGFTCATRRLAGAWQVVVYAR